MLTDAIMAQITKRHQGPSMTRARFDEGFECLHGLECYMCVLGCNTCNRICVWLDLRWFHLMCWWGLACYVDHVWIAQHAHISQTYYLLGLSADSALHYPTLPRGPPLATLAPKSIQLPETCELLVNQKPAKPLSQFEVLDIMFCCWCPGQHPSSNPNITSTSKILP